mmetsp:Transcript_125467/g.244396  ORF Transcript_125467/g.244396 Transcript_125467/m.244396 type:complete len:535 (-) Transcript_125467:315-1919(-)
MLLLNGRPGLRQKVSPERPRRVRGLPCFVAALASFCATTSVFVVPGRALRGTSCWEPVWQPRAARHVLKAASDAAPLEQLSVAILGGGPSGLLLAHRLLDAGACVQIFDGRADPRSDAAALEGRAYALGLGVRGRTAIRSAYGGELWDAVSTSGFGSERFKLHFSPSFSLDLRTPEDSNGLEPSLLVYQTDLCGALLQDLDDRYASTGRFCAYFETSAESVDPLGGAVTVCDGNGSRSIGPVDLIAGCDGVNSVTRDAIARDCAGFEADVVPLPGKLKVLRFPLMPKNLDASAVHAIPGSGGTSAFIEPTARGVCALINWRDVPNKEGDTEAGSKKDSATPVDFSSLADADEARDALAARFPLLADVIDLDCGRQFVQQQTSKASTVKCNTYHYGKAVLLGDAAHSTGGASGQGCNSALQDSAALADKLIASGGSVGPALLAYSRHRVPEGHALLDLSLGPGEAAGPLRRALYGMSTLKDTVLSRFQLSEPPLQTLLTTTLESFSDIRRRRDFFFGDFPSDATFAAKIAELGKH